MSDNGSTSITNAPCDPGHTPPATDEELEGEALPPAPDSVSTRAEPYAAGIIGRFYGFAFRS